MPNSPVWKSQWLVGDGFKERYKDLVLLYTHWDYNRLKDAMGDEDELEIILFCSTCFGSIDISGSNSEEEVKTSCGGAVKVGLGTLFEGVLSFFKTLSQQKKEEIEKIYKEKLDSIKANFDKEIALRSENIKNLDKKLSAFSQAFQSGQIGAQEYYQISQQINQEKKQEELEQARSKKLQELKSLELTREKEYKLEEAKWFPNKNKLAQLQEEINKLKSRQTKASQANSLEEIHLASQGALTRVNKPTLFLAGEKGDELVKIKPLQAPIHPFLEEAKQQPFAPVFHFNISGFVGDEIALSRRLTQMIQSSIHILGEREFKP
ncbi:UNVERIFIED_CONTAM: hypothetical protein PYX00_011933 [Menopon gallinae]|uniref:Uncharacterized protein n=1 Tax=Menopon gallinae TaxID=328185 RepID=A0AAW2H953_9NEOP